MPRHMPRHTPLRTLLALSALALPAFAQQPATPEPAETPAAPEPAETPATPAKAAPGEGDAKPADAKPADAKAPLQYRWTINAHERVFGADPATPQTDRVADATVMSTVDTSRPGVVVLTVTSIDMTIPDTPMGPLSFDSEADAAADAGNPLAAPLRQVMNTPFSFSYNPTTGVIEGPQELERMPGAKILGGLLAQPYVTAALYPFFEDPTDDREARTYTMIPAGPAGPVIEARGEFDLDETGDETPTIGGDYSAKAEGLYKGQIPGDGMSLSLNGEAKATYADGAVHPKAHSAKSTVETNLMMGPNQPVRSIAEFQVAAVRVEG